MDENERRLFLNFCYPSDMPFRSKEIDYDRGYWKHSTNFTIKERNDRIVACVQLIRKQDGMLMPLEYAKISSGLPDAGQPFDVATDCHGGRVAEIYRLRRTFDVSMEKVVTIINMIFKAIWAKIIQDGLSYLYLTCDSESAELRNLYLRRLRFEDTAVTVQYGTSLKNWSLLRKDCLLHERQYASLGPRNFEFQTYCRSHLKNKRLIVNDR
ncbi:MAG: hypothetical protein V1913_13895 [Fibrobacterota bacterium]